MGWPKPCPSARDLASVPISLCLPFCGVGCSFGAAGKGDLRMRLEPRVWIFVNRETVDFNGNRKDSSCMPQGVLCSLSPESQECFSEILPVSSKKGRTLALGQGSWDRGKRQTEGHCGLVLTYFPDCVLHQTRLETGMVFFFSFSFGVPLGCPAQAWPTGAVE